jgi:hypothetical protein
MACWGIGRLLGPQLMVAGGGHPTSQWFGMYYAGQPGKRLPVPIFQSIEDFTIFGILLLVERWLRRSAPVAATGEDGAPGATLLPPSGIVLGVGMVLWGVERFLDEHLWLGEDGHLGSLLVQWAGIALAVAGAVLLVSRLGPLQRWRRGEGGDPAPQPFSSSDGPEALADGQDGEDGTVDGDGGVGEDDEGADLGDRGDGGGTPTPVPSTAPSRGSTDG